MVTHPLLVKRLTEKRFRKLWEKSDEYLYARYCPVDVVSSIPIDCIRYGEEVYVSEIHEGNPLIVSIQVNWQGTIFTVPFTDIAVSKNTAHK